jgi:hypothetical protein
VLVKILSSGSEAHGTINNNAIALLGAVKDDVVF